MPPRGTLATRRRHPARSGCRCCPDDVGAKLVETAECAEVQARENSVRHVEVFPIGSVRTPIQGA